MALANFFDKVSLGAAQILQGFDRTKFEEILLSHRIMVFYDDSASISFEGKATLDLLIRLLSRLYPNIQIYNSDSNSLVSELEVLAKAINPDIELSKSFSPTICIVVGNTKSLFEVPTFYIGSNNWIAHFSQSKPVGSGHSNNPFASGAVACFGAANIFRTVFAEQLPYSKNDEEFSFSLLEFTTDNNFYNPEIGEINIDETVLVGLGAIGNGVVWALSKLPKIEGSLILVDHEPIELSNLQRYILADQNSIDKKKVDIANVFLQHTSLKIHPVPSNWNDYITARASWNIKSVAVCVDSAEDRIEVQGALPKKIFNAWTQQEDIGVSRHIHFVESACLCCLYFPTDEKKSISQEIADSLNFIGIQEERIIRDYLANNKMIDEWILNLIAQKNNIQIEDLRFTVGKSLHIFYHEVVCGGRFMKLKNGADGSPQKIEVPSAFESALAGILLAIEIVNNTSHHRKTNLSTVTRFNLLRPLSPYINFEENKKPNCICNDAIFQKSYLDTWN